MRSRSHHDSHYESQLDEERCAKRSQQQDQDSASEECGKLSSAKEQLLETDEEAAAQGEQESTAGYETESTEASSPLPQEHLLLAEDEEEVEQDAAETVPAAPQHDDIK